MPNYCFNTVHLAHNDPQMIERAVSAFKQQRFCEEFIPTPAALMNEEAFMWSSGCKSKQRDQLRAQLYKEYGYENGREFRIANWGSKWDIGTEGDVTVHDANNVTLSFPSAWTPITGVYQELVDLGFEVEAYYYESGVGFCGKFTNDCGDEYYEIDGDSDWVDENIPQDINEEFSISQTMCAWEEE